MQREREQRSGKKSRLCHFSAILLSALLALTSCSLSFEVIPETSTVPAVTTIVQTTAEATRDPADLWPTAGETELNEADRWVPPSPTGQESKESEPTGTTLSGSGSGHFAISASTVPPESNAAEAGTATPSYEEITAAGDKALEESFHYLQDKTAFEEAFAYFRDVAFTSEYNDNGMAALKRWPQPIRVKLSGSYTEANVAVLERTIGWLSKIEGMPEITIADDNTNHDFHFVPLVELESVVDNYPAGNWGIAYVTWQDFNIERGLCAVASDVMTEEEMTHIIQEEFIQSFGLLNDTYAYPDSLFQQEWTVAQHPSAIDFALIRMLYSPAVSQGMSPDEAYQALTGYYFPSGA